jgi:glycosyltransferase involved in cell wall biosynthesis
MNRSEPSISLIIAVYNQADCLPGLFSSIEAQEGDLSREVIVCDDGSQDETHACVQSWALNQHADVRYMWQPDQGFRLGRSRNNGIRGARGDLLVFIDGNSVLEPFFLRDHWQAHLCDGARLVYGGRRRVKFPASASQATQAGQAAPRDGLQGPSDLEYRRRWLETPYPWMACIGANLSLRRQHAVLFDETFEGWGSEDRDFAYRLWKAGLAMRVLDRLGLVQVVRGEPENWNPLIGGHHAIVAALKCKVHLYRKYSVDIMFPSLADVRLCHLDRRTNTWRLGRRRDDAEIPAILEEFAQWLESSSESHA